MSQTTEHAFETYVEEILLTRGGWTSGSNAEWDKDRALFPPQLFAFIAATQPRLWAAMRTLHAAGLEALLLAALVKELDAKGMLHILRHDFKFYGKLFRLAYFKPAHGVNFETIALFNKNRLTVTRQVPCHPGDNRTLDMVLALNGLPVATVELKNPGTGQTWRHAARQYRETRDPRAPLFAFKKRALVHFAADSEEIHMTTRWAGAKVFDCVVVITDRQVLDRQLQDAIYQIEHAQGVVKAIDQDSKQLAAALIDGAKIVITTLQKSPFVLRGLLHAAGAESQEEATTEQKADAANWEAEIVKRRYAVIVDEAHSSQTGEAARELKEILGKRNHETHETLENGSLARDAQASEDEPDWEDRLNQIMQSRGRQPNLSFFAFTATPKGKTLELFGRPGVRGLPEAFHLYSMRQAIEESFIPDVVKNYTTYTTYYRLVKAIEDDPDLPKKRAARALAKFIGHRCPSLGGLQRHRQRSGPTGRGVRRAGHEQRLRERQAHRREAASGAVWLA